jgi:hypothetical protein
MAVNRIRLTTGGDPNRAPSSGSRAQPGGTANVARLDAGRRRLLAAIERRLSELERDLDRGRHPSVRQALPATIELVEQVERLAGDKQRTARLTMLIQRSQFATRYKAPVTTSQGFTKRLRHRP